jgi:hypothetical protein
MTGISRKSCHTNTEQCTQRMGCHTHHNDWSSGSSRLCLHLGEETCHSYIFSKKANVTSASVRLYSSQSQNLLCNLWLFYGLGTVVRVLFAITHWHSSLADVATTSRQCMSHSGEFSRYLPVRPVSGTLPGLEQLSLQVHILLLRELPRSHADILHVSDKVSFREAGVVHGARVP